MKTPTKRNVYTLLSICYVVDKVVSALSTTKADSENVSTMNTGIVNKVVTKCSEKGE